MRKEERKENEKGRKEEGRMVLLSLLNKKSEGEKYKHLNKRVSLFRSKVIEVISMKELVRRKCIN